jgi:hypothetical protein
MTKYALCFFFCIALLFNANGQQLISASATQSTGHNYSLSMQEDASGNIYSTGYFSDSMIFDSLGLNFSLKSAGLYDAFVMKTNSNGKLIWAKQLGGKRNDVAYSVSLTPQNEVVVAGHFNDTMYFNQNPTNYVVSSGDFDAYVAKLTSDGNLIWMKRFGGKGADQAHCVKVNSTGYIYVTGVFIDSADFRPSNQAEWLVSKGVSNGYVLKLNAMGNLVWVNHLASNNTLYSRTLALDNNEDIFVGGHFSVEADFDRAVNTNITKTTQNSFYLLKLNPLGQFDWVTHCATSEYGSITDIAFSNKNEIYATGTFYGTMRLNTSDGKNLKLTNESEVSFISKYNYNGEPIWVNVLYSGSRNTAYAIATGNNSNVYVCGYSNSNTDFDPTENEYFYSGSHFLASYTEQGKIAWVTAFVANPSYAFDIIQKLNGQIMIVGSYQYSMYTMPFPNKLVFGRNDFNTTFFQTFSDCGIVPTVIQNKDTLSTIELKDATYKWLYCNSNPEILDSNYYFTPNLDGEIDKYRVLIEQNGCEVYSSCIQFVETASLFDNTIDTIQVYPNPTTNYIHLNLPKKVISLSLYNTFGIAVWSSTNLVEKIDMSTYASGAYVLRITTDTTTYFAKVIKQ